MIDRAERQGQIFARELENEENPELLDIWKAITALTDKFESELDELIEELALDKIAGPSSIDDEEADEIRTLELDSTKDYLKEIILRENILGDELDDGLDYLPEHNSVYDTIIEG